MNPTFLAKDLWYANIKDEEKKEGEEEKKPEEEKELELKKKS